MVLSVIFCISLLAACQPFNENTTTVALNDFYLPITDVEASQFYIGMPYEEVLEQLQPLKKHKDYTVKDDFFFLRVADGRSMVIELLQTREEEHIRLTVKGIHLYDIKTLTDRRTFEALNGQEMKMAEFIAAVGLPIQANYTASVGGLYFPVSDGSVCYMNYITDTKIYIGNFYDKDVLIYEE